MIALSCNAQIKKRQSSRLDSRGIGSLLEDNGKSGFHHLQGHSLPIGGLYTQRMHSVYVVFGLPPLQYRMVAQDSRPRANLPVLLILAVREQCKARTVNPLDPAHTQAKLGPRATDGVLCMRWQMRPWERFVHTARRKLALMSVHVAGALSRWLCVICAGRSWRAELKDCHDQKVKSMTLSGSRGTAQGVANC